MTIQPDYQQHSLAVWDVQLPHVNFKNSTVYPHCYCRRYHTAPQESVSPHTFLMDGVSPHTVHRHCIFFKVRKTSWFWNSEQLWQILRAKRKIVPFRKSHGWLLCPVIILQTQLSPYYLDLSKFLSEWWCWHSVTYDHWELFKSNECGVSVAYVCYQRGQPCLVYFLNLSIQPIV